LIHFKGQTKEKQNDLLHNAYISLIVRKGAIHMDTAQVLLVDDDPMLLQALSQTIELRMSVVELEVVDSAQAALALLEQHTYSAIVSDIKMPGMDGLGLLAHAHDHHPTTPVILMTGHSDHQLAIQALRGGAYDYILKPVDRDDFVASLQRALHTYQLHRQVEEQQRALERYSLSLERLIMQRNHELDAAKRATEEVLRALAEQHGGRVEFHEQPDGEEKLSIVLPSSPRTPK
jgi:DNA-binding NtrC family response regulator